MVTARLELIALPELPLVRPGDDLVALIDDSLKRADIRLQDGDVLVLAQKIVSKANGRIVDLRHVKPSEKARSLAAEVDKDARMIELILREADEVVAQRPGVLVVAHRLGVVMANAGIDASNVEQDDGSERVLLLPEDPDADCRCIRAGFAERHGANVAVIINDSVGRAWRNGTVGLALGSAGLPALLDLRGNRDLFGRELMVSQQAIADELASAASLMQGQGAEGQPVVLIRGMALPEHAGTGDGGAEVLIRPKNEDLFR